MPPRKKAPKRKADGDEDVGFEAGQPTDVGDKIDPLHQEIKEVMMKCEELVTPKMPQVNNVITMAQVANCATAAVTTVASWAVGTEKSRLQNKERSLKTEAEGLYTQVKDLKSKLAGARVVYNNATTENNNAQAKYRELTNKRNLLTDQNKEAVNAKLVDESDRIHIERDKVDTQIRQQAAVCENTENAIKPLKRAVEQIEKELTPLTNQYSAVYKEWDTAAQDLVRASTQATAETWAQTKIPYENKCAAIEQKRQKTVDDAQKLAEQELADAFKEATAPILLHTALCNELKSTRTILNPDPPTASDSLVLVVDGGA